MPWIPSPTRLSTGINFQNGPPAQSGLDLILTVNGTTGFSVTDHGGGISLSSDGGGGISINALSGGLVLQSGNDSPDGMYIGAAANFLGFFGAAPVAQPTVPTVGVVTVQNVVDALVALGLVDQL